MSMITLLASTWWPPILQTAIGGLIGAFGAIAGGAFGSWFTWQKERQSVAAALAGEVEGFMAVTEWYQTPERSRLLEILRTDCTSTLRATRSREGYLWLAPIRASHTMP